MCRFIGTILILIILVSSAAYTQSDSFQDCGTIIQGAECILFDSDNFGVYVMDNLGGFSVGDRVRVEGILNVTCITFCMQGNGCIENNTIEVCPTLLEACCLPNGCQMLTPQSCIAAGGSPMGLGTQCTAPQACCFRGGGCSMMDPLCCIFMVTGTPGGLACLGDNNGDGIDDACLPCTPAPSGMVAWWPLDEQAGTKANDLALANNIGILQNSPTPIPVGKVDGALSFHGLGVNDFVSVAPQAELDFGTGDFSIDCWINPSSPVGGIVGKFDPISGKGFALVLDLLVGSGGEMIRFFANSGSDVVAASYSIDGNWHHVAVTVLRSGSSATVTLYYDGVIKNQNTISLGSVNNAEPLEIGRATGVGYYSFTGGIDEVELFNRALDPGEVSSLFLADSAGKCKPASIPTLTEWGLIIFGVVLLGFISWVFLRRRKVIGVRL